MSNNDTFINLSCPHLPRLSPASPLPITHPKAYREACDDAYFKACLELAQSLWCTGYPAQAILQLDKAFMAKLNAPTSNINSVYLAICWIIQNSPSEQFLGNPVRHFQHLATRMNMNQPNAKIRIWRAWACLHLTEKLFPYPAEIYLRDEAQITKENINIPTTQETLHQLTTLTTLQENVLLENLLLQHSI